LQQGYVCTYRNSNVDSSVYLVKKTGDVALPMDALQSNSKREKKKKKDKYSRYHRQYHNIPVSEDFLKKYYRGTRDVIEQCHAMFYTYNSDTGDAYLPPIVHGYDYYISCCQVNAPQREKRRAGYFPGDYDISDYVIEGWYKNNADLLTWIRQMKHPPL
jgi:hypothetical protein